MDNELVVLVHDRVLGRVTLTKTGRMQFDYDEAWRQSVDAFPLSMSMPLAQASHAHATIHAFVSGLLPDNDDVKRAIARRYGLKSATPFRLAGAIGEDMAGAVQLVASDRLAALKKRQGGAQIKESDLAEYLAALREAPGQINITEDAGRFSLASARPKKAVYWVNGKWFELRGRTPSTHIIKPPIPWLEGQVENEHFCLRLAAELGLTAARSEVVSIGNRPNIVVWRYDRQRRKGAKLLGLTEEGGTVVRVHQEDMCQAHAVEPFRKCQADGGPGMKPIMALLAGSGSPAIDRGRFKRACIMNFLLLGTDAHAKNFSILIEPGRFRLAPLYDLISLLPYEREVLNSRTLEMAISGENKWRSIGLSHWRKAAAECGYPSEQALEELKMITRQMPDTAQSVLRACKGADLTAPVLPRLAAAIGKRCAAVEKSFGF